MFGNLLISRFIARYFHIFLRVTDSRVFPPPLSPEEEKKYFIKCKNGDKKAREILIEHNLRLVAHIIKKYYTSCKNQDDLMSIGTIGLIKAIDSFDVNNGVRFATYASKCLQNEILMYFRSQKKLSCEVSINEAVDIDKDGNPLTYIDIISCEDTIAEDLDIKINSDKAYKIIREKLNDREREIIVLRYGLNRKAAITQREIAEKLGISRSYVSRIEKGALEKIFKNLK